MAKAIVCGTDLNHSLNEGSHGSVNEGNRIGGLEQVVADAGKASGVAPLVSVLGLSCSQCEMQILNCGL